ncbi:hypothetical protein Natpe_1976 [Natrinema pellirubrum DSM 15624]|uniref:Uncharacterized protein n=1 Tax=Natrinema pellirubrum (strain DSM 15624 / CIP 106293 / JCM 10476 / NCIMB 786 / 157) TaxID=797303 RepID=L0JMM9_NATP1|nr:hypothetical protein Natpe_1976 [Natrinema pellirubrum DSM 15624]
MNGNSNTASSALSERERAILLQEQDPIAVLQSLPTTVFPVTATVKLDRTQSDDQPHSEYQEPSYPVEVQQPVDTPYIPETRIYFDNPAERAPDGATVWGRRHCTNELQTIVDYLDTESDADPDRLKLSDIVFVEVPPRYLTSNSGEHGVSPELYNENGEMTLAYFQKDSSLSAHNVRDDLGDALPGQSRSPLQLIRVDEVTAKPARTGQNTTRQASRCQYYTTSEAESHNKLDATPGIWQARRVSDSSENIRPLSPVVQDFNSFLPAFADSDLIESVTFSGQTQTRERFHAEEILGS